MLQKAKSEVYINDNDCNFYNDKYKVGQNKMSA